MSSHQFSAAQSQSIDPNDSLGSSLGSELPGSGSVLEIIAADLYRIGSMILGEGEDTIGLIEQAVTTVDISSDSEPASHSGRLALAAGAIELIQRHDPAQFAAPADDSGPASCIEDDELDAAGVTRAELEQMLAGEDARSLRTWLEGLAVPLRVIFVLRAVAGLSSVEVAALLAEHGGPTAENWTPDAVRGNFRQALCSLASQLLHASNTR
jgi:hypothetical protein